MGPKRFLAFFFSAWTTMNMSEAQTCKRPANALNITADQLKGTWSHQMNAGSDEIYFNFACDKEEYTFTTPTTGWGANSAFDKGNGKFLEKLFQITLLGNQLVRYKPDKNPRVNIFMYIILWKEYEFVGTVCYYVTNAFIQQYEVVMTRAQTKTHAYSEALMREAGVTYTTPYFYTNGDDCYDRRRCKCPAN